LRGQYVFNPPYLILGLNLTIIGGIDFIVAYLSAKGYLLTGSLTLLLITLSFVSSGILGIMNGIFANFSSNWAVTAAAFGLLLFSVLQIFASFQGSFRSAPIGSENRKVRLTLVCSAAVFISLFLSLLVWLNVFPTFFVNGVGVTVFDQIVYSVVIFLFALNCVLFLRLYLKSKANVLYWYTLALALDTIGLYGLTLQVRYYDIVVWTARLGVYIATIYFLIALLSSRKSNKEAENLPEI